MVPNGWSNESLKDICSKTISYGIVQTGENLESGVPCVRVVDLSKNTLNPIDMIKTSDEIHKSYKKTILCEGELMMALRGEIGLVKKVTSELIGANITRGLARLSPIKSVDSDYLLWTLRSNKIKNELARKSGGSALQEIALGSLRKIVLPIPPLSEQRKIAKILSTWDKTISTTEKLIETSKQQKKALMQQLLTGKKRLVNPETGKVFQGEWGSKSPVSLFKLFSGFAFKSTDAKDSGAKWLKIANVGIGEIKWDADSFLPEYFLSEHKKFVLTKGDIVVALTRPTLGNRLKVARLTKDSDTSLLNQRVAKIVCKDNVDSEFIFQVLRSDQFAYRINVGLLGTDPPNLSIKVLEDFEILVPPYLEQQKIASVLTVADKEIEVLETKLSHFKQEKKALMQQLLTGKRRVVVDAA
ncbi:restriction endonuclease subunit S [Aliivibrio kagoshimensis]|uniref:restriction endonuclease subunit S n=1 Tax=Aliivibrio kagoshimensis TaxID=2910230 RepID=UPI003D13109B